MALCGSRPWPSWGEETHPHIRNGVVTGLQQAVYCRTVSIRSLESAPRKFTHHLTPLMTGQPVCMLCGSCFLLPGARL